MNEICWSEFLWVSKHELCASQKTSYTVIVYQVYRWGKRLFHFLNSDDDMASHELPLLEYCSLSLAQITFLIASLAEFLHLSSEFSSLDFEEKKNCVWNKFPAQHFFYVFLVADVIYFILLSPANFPIAVILSICSWPKTEGNQRFTLNE